MPPSLAPSAGFHRRDHLNIRQHDTPSVSDLTAAISVSEDCRQWPAVRRTEPKAQQMSLAFEFRPILVIGAIMQDHVVMDELDIAGLEFDIEIRSEERRVGK